MRKRSGVPSGELSDTRRLGSADARWYTSQGEEAVFRRRSIVTRMVDAARGRSRAFPRSERRVCVALPQLPRVHCAVTVGADNRRKTHSVLRGEAEGRAESPQKQGFGTKPQFRRAEPGGTLLGEADCTGLDPEAVYVYGERVEGRARRPPQRASTVARNKAARWKASTRAQSH